MFRENHPVQYFFNKLKQRARERGHEFSLTLEEFRMFFEQKGDRMGKTKDCLSFDRINPNEGYHAGNLRVITVSENIRRRFVPYFQSKEEEAEAIQETEAQMKRLIESGAFAETACAK